MHEPLKSGRVDHFTSLSNRASVERAGVLRACQPHPSDYQGEALCHAFARSGDAQQPRERQSEQGRPQQGRREDRRPEQGRRHELESEQGRRYELEPIAPKCVYFRTQPQSEPAFPFSFHTREPAGAELAVLSVDLRELLDAKECRLYLCALLPSQYGPNFAARVHAHVAAVPPEFVAFAEEHFVRLEEGTNRILYFDSKREPWIATKVHVPLEIDIGSLPSADADADVSLRDADATPTEALLPRSYPLSVSLAVMSDVHLASSAEVTGREASADAAYGAAGGENTVQATWSRGMRLRNSPDDAFPPTIECPDAECDYAYPGMGNLMEHYRYEHADAQSRKMRCHHAGCTAAFSSRGAWRDHMRQHDGVSFACSTSSACGRTFATRERLREHIRVDHENRVYSCPREGCSRQFKYRSGLGAHIRSHHDDLSFECALCSARFKSRSGLRSHTLAVHEAKRYSCQVASCDTVFAHLSSQRAHMRTMHPAAALVAAAAG